MAITIKQAGTPALFGVFASASATDEPIFTGDFSVDFNTVSLLRRNRTGQKASRVDYDVDISWSLSGELSAGGSTESVTAGNAATLALPLGTKATLPLLGAEDDLSALDSAVLHPGSGILTATTGYHAYIDSMSTSSSREAFRQGSTSGVFLPF